MAEVRACVFDAYGTLFDVHSAVARHASRIGPAADQVSALWRQRQTEYSWTRSLMGQYQNFEVLTREALEFAMASHGINDPALKSDLLDAYLRLSAFEEVPSMLRQLKAAGQRVAILSNGTKSMVSAAVSNSGLGVFIDEIYTVDDAKIFKPHPSVYELVTQGMGVKPQEVAFQSSNPWDAAGALAFGFQVFWVNRKKQPFEYGFKSKLREMSSLAELPALIAPGR